MTESPSDSPCVTLLAAAEWGLWVEVERALADVAAPIDDRDAEGHSAMHWAASHGHAPTVEALLARGADPNSPGDDGWTAVMWAAHSGSLPCLTALVGAGGDVNVEVEGGEGALAQVLSSFISKLCPPSAQSLLLTEPRPDTAGRLLDAGAPFGCRWCTLPMGTQRGA